MTRFRSFLIAGAFWVFVWTLPCVAAEAPYKPGEVIRYNIKQGPIKMGEASLTFVGEKDMDGRKAVLILFSSKGTAFFDNEEIYVDPLTLRPLKVLRDPKIFGGHERITETYSPDGKIVISKDADGKKTETVLTRNGPIDNIYGFIYRYRSEGDFSPKQMFKVGLPTVDLTMTVVDDGNFNAAGKTYRSAIIRSVPSKYTIWMDKGEKRLPLRIAGAVGIGNTVMTMVSVEQGK
jgi:hypothetical protein